MHSSLLLPAALSLLLSALAPSPAGAVHQSSHEIVRRADGTYEAKELVTRDERERRDELHRRQSVGAGGVGVGLSGASAGVGNVTLKIGNIKVTTGDVLLDTIHIGDITVLVSAGVGKRDAVPAQSPLPDIPGLPSFAPGQIPDGPVQAVVVAGDDTVIYTPPSSTPTSTPNADGDRKELHHTGSLASAPTALTRTVERGAAAVVTASPTVHDFQKRQNVSVGPVGASVGPIGVGIGNVNVTVGDVNVKLGDITVKNVTIGNILVSVAINAQHALETILGVLPSVVSDVTGVVSGVVSDVTGAAGQAEGAAHKTSSGEEAKVTRFVKMPREA